MISAPEFIVLIKDIINLNPFGKVQLSTANRIDTNTNTGIHFTAFCLKPFCYAYCLKPFQLKGWERTTSWINIRLKLEKFIFCRESISKIKKEGNLKEKLTIIILKEWPDDFYYFSINKRDPTYLYTPIQSFEILSTIAINLYS